MARVVAVVAAAPAARGGLPAAHAPPLVAVFALYPGLLGVGVGVGVGGVIGVVGGGSVGGGGAGGGGSCHPSSTSCRATRVGSD